MSDPLVLAGAALISALGAIAVTWWIASRMEDEE